MMFKRHLFKIASTLALFTASITNAFAQTYDYYYDDDVLESTFGLYYLCICLCSVPFFLFWLWMLIDAIKSNHRDKALWVVLIVLTGVLGAALYFFLARKKDQIDPGVKKTEIVDPSHAPSAPHHSETKKHVSTEHDHHSVPPPLPPDNGGTTEPPVTV